MQGHQTIFRPAHTHVEKNLRGNKQNIFIIIGSRNGECDPDATLEKHAVRIFRHYEERLQNLQKPHDIARLLHEEKIEVAVEKITDRDFSLNTKITLLLSDIQYAIRKDHKVLIRFAEICMLTGNEDIGNDILKDCSKFYNEAKTDYVYKYVLSASVFEQSDAVFDSQLREGRFTQCQLML